MPPLFIYHEILGNIYVLSLNLLLVIKFPSIYHGFWNKPSKVFKPYVWTHQVVIIVIIVILTLGCFIMSKATLMIFYHTSILTLRISLISHAFLVATSVSLHSLECISFIIEVKILVLIKWSCRSPHLCWLLSLWWSLYFEHVIQSLSNTCLFNIRSWSHTTPHTTQI